MKFETKSLRSKVSKRIFSLFILSALIPILTIYLISYNQISEQLDNETRRQLYRESRSLGLTIYDKLLSLETNLKIITNELERGVQPETFKQDEWLQSIFSGMFIQYDSGIQQALFGEVNPVYELNENQLEHLKNNNTVFYISYPNNQRPQYFLIHNMEYDNNQPGYLVAQINDNNFWNFPVYSPEIACALSHSAYTLYCSSSIEGYNRENLFSDLDITGEDSFDFWNFNDIEYAVNSWNVFLRARFASEDIFLVMAVPRKTAFFTFNDFTSTFPKILIITGLLVALVSISQIRKTLTPLQKLTDGTNRIIRGQFDEPVDINSGDEFEKLATSFNNMARHINEQFKTTSILAEIDRLILSSLDTDYIIEILIKYLGNIIAVDHVCVITLDDENKSSALLHINIDNEFKLIQKQKLKLVGEDLREMEMCDDHLLLKDAEHREYTKQLRILGDKFFLVFPVHIKGELSGIICLGKDADFDASDDKLRQIKELSDRVAVALSNAVWEEKLYFQAHYDSLTKLPNRFLFQDRLEQAIQHASRENSNIAVLFLDLDRFKDVNDSLGHASGDNVLTQAAQTMAEYIRKYDSIARLGGDEFAIFISDINDIDEIVIKAEELSRRILRSMRDPFILESREIYLSVSIGIAIYPRDGDNYNDLLKNADSAMYDAKTKGRNNYQFYDKKNSLIIIEKLDLEQGLRHAIEKNELNLYYQPKIDCKSGEVIGSEALLRWQHPERGLIYPDQFIPRAEETGHVVTIGNWVLEQACLQHKMMLDEGVKNITIAVNISSEQFKQTDFFNLIENILEKTELPPEYLELEITESITIEDFERTKGVIYKLKDLGISISIDDFGTGYSSLSYLQQFPVDKLKIDQAFISKLPDDKNNSSIVKTIIALAHSLELSVIAEGVEKQAQSDFLLAAGCDEIQGYIITQPLSAENFKLFMLRESAHNHSV